MRTHAIDRMLRLARGAGVISFAGGLPAAETLPREEMLDAAREAMLRMGESPLQYDWPEGRSALRTLIANRLQGRGAQVDADDVIVTSGAQDALCLAIEVLGCREVEVDSITYPGAVDLFAARGIAAVTERPADVAYVMPAVHNPWGWSATPLQRAASLCAEWIIEDDAYAELRFDGAAPTPLLAEAPDRVFHLGTVSKTLSPALRIGWLVAPRRWQKKLREAKARRDLHASGLTQAIAEHLMGHGHYDLRLSRLRRYYSERCDKLLAVLPGIARARFSVPSGGFSLWLEVECSESDEAFLKRALANGVAFDPGVLFRPEDSAAPERLGMRLSFSSVEPALIEEGIQRLALTLQQAKASVRPLVA